jgi:hypothetical protein
VEPVKDLDYAHFKNWIDAIEAAKPELCNNDPELGAAAVTTVILGAQSYRNGIVYYFDPATGPVNASEAHQQGKSWAKGWEQLSAQRGKPRHIPGWKAGDYGSRKTCRSLVPGSTASRRNAGEAAGTEIRMVGLIVLRTERDFPRRLAGG